MADTPPTLEQIAQALWDASEAFTEEGPRGFGAAPKPVLMAMAEAVTDLYAPPVEPRSSGEREAEYRRLVDDLTHQAVHYAACDGDAKRALDAFVLPLLRQRGPDALALIAVERRRQVEAEGWSAEHDDEEHSDGALAKAAAVYALPDALREYERRHIVSENGGRDQVWQEPRLWPFDSDFKPTPNDRIRELVKAGALIAAEIDRLNRAALSRETP